MPSKVTSHSLAVSGAESMNDKPPAFIKQIEAETKRPITIHTSLTSQTLSKCHQQLQSPLFALPAELREIIFTLATAPYYAPDSFFEQTDPRYHLNHDARIISSMGLLSTCRRIWLETNHLPMQQWHHCFYMPDLSWSWVEPKASTQKLTTFAAKLTPHTRPLLQHLHIFADLRYFASHAKGHLMPLLLSTAGACPGVLTLTVRHQDWPDWRLFRPFGPWAPGQWLTDLLAYQASPYLKDIRLELETIESRTPELRPIAANLRDKHAIVERVDELGNAVRVELQAEPPERRWSGAAREGEVDLPTLGGSQREGSRIFSLVWKVRAVREEDEGRKEVHVPNVEFSDADREPVGQTGPENVEARKRWEEKWEREESLLRFAE